MRFPNQLSKKLIAITALSVLVASCGGKQISPGLDSQPEAWKQLYEDAPCGFRHTVPEDDASYVYFVGASSPSADQGTGRSKGQLAAEGQYARFVEATFRGAAKRVLKETVLEDDRKILSVYKAFESSMAQTRIHGGKVTQYCDLWRPFTKYDDSNAVEYACMVLYRVPKQSISDALDPALEAAVETMRQQRFLRAEFETGQVEQELKQDIMDTLQAGGSAGEPR